jgi:hypothetical protein
MLNTDTLIWLNPNVALILENISKNLAATPDNVHLFSGANTNELKPIPLNLLLTELKKKYTAFYTNIHGIVMDNNAFQYGVLSYEYNVASSLSLKWALSNNESIIGDVPDIDYILSVEENAGIKLPIHRHTLYRDIHNIQHDYAYVYSKLSKSMIVFEQLAPEDFVKSMEWLSSDLTQKQIFSGKNPRYTKLSFK